MSETKEIILPCEPGELIGIDGSEVAEVNSHGFVWEIGLAGCVTSWLVDKYGRHNRPPYPQIVIRKPKPKTVVKPWNFETMPIGVKVRGKNDHSAMHVAVPYDESIARFLDVCAVSYAELLDEWEQLDGTPCGLVEVTP